MADEIEVTIINWDKYNTRGDVKKSSWFRLQHSVWRDSQFFRFTASERWTWICLLSYLSEKDSDGTETVDVDWFCQEANISREILQSAIEKLTLNGCVTYTSRERTADVVLRTNERTNVTGKCEGSCDFMQLWNAHCGTLPKVSVMNKSRRAAWSKRWNEKPDEEYWLLGIKKLAKSSFATGNGNGGWKATADWFLSNDKNHVKAFEGNYDDKKDGRIVMPAGT